MVDLNQYIGISDGWRIRNDKSNIIAYRSSVEGHVFKVFPRFFAPIVPLLDGTRTIKQLAEIWYKIYGQDYGAFSKSVNVFISYIEELLQTEDMISTNSEEISPSLLKHPNQYLPDYDNYKFPAYRLERPLTAMIAFTNKCLCDCLYCSAQRRDCTELDLNEWIRIFDDLAANGIYLVDIAGGDIFARRDALDILEAMVERQFSFFLSTKSHISKDTAFRLAEMGIGVTQVPKSEFRRVQISLDSTDNDVASTLVNRPDYFEKASESIQNLLLAGINPRIKAVLTSYNHDAPEKIVEYFSKLGVTTFAFVYYSKRYYRHDDTLFLTNEQKKHIVKLEKRLAKQYKDLTITIQSDDSEGYAISSFCEQWDKRAICTGGRSNLVIQPNGDVLLCDQIPHVDVHVVGNLHSHKLNEVWNSERLMRFIYPDRMKFEDKACYDCNDFEKCMHERGYCYRDALFYYGSIHDAPPKCPRQNKPNHKKT